MHDRATLAPGASFGRPQPLWTPAPVSRNPEPNRAPLCTPPPCAPARRPECGGVRWPLPHRAHPEASPEPLISILRSMFAASAATACALRDWGPGAPWGRPPCPRPACFKGAFERPAPARPAQPRRGPLGALLPRSAWLRSGLPFFFQPTRGGGGAPRAEARRGAAARGGNCHARPPPKNYPSPHPLPAVNCKRTR
ncbi:MAG: hypothetical protein J3K34DRAFT_414573, partial [Monoraphidium minutum]